MKQLLPSEAANFPSLGIKTGFFAGYGYCKDISKTPQSNLIYMLEVT
jgi:hypothetical protein